MTPALKLNTGVTMPAIGFGVFQSPPEETVAAVETALRGGYRLIDTAAAYGNEREVGEAIRRSGVDRDEICVITKLWISDYGHEATQVGFDASLRRLGLDHVDLYLLHQPVPTDFEATIGAYTAAEKMLGRGSDARNRRLQLQPAAPPAADRPHRHRAGDQPGGAAPLLHAARSPGGPRRAGHRHPGLVADRRRPRLRARRRRSPRSAGRSGHRRPRCQVRQDPAQVVLRWHIEHGFCAIPKSVKPHRIAENFDVFDFSLTTEEVAALDALDTGVRGGPDPELLSPETMPLVVDNS